MHGVMYDVDVWMVCHVIQYNIIATLNCHVFTVIIELSLMYTMPGNSLRNPLTNYAYNLLGDF